MRKFHDFIEIADYDPESLEWLLRTSAERKSEFVASQLRPVLAGKSLAMYFDKPSLRTRISFEVAMQQLGGHAIYLTPTEIGIGKREPVQDVARVIAGMCDGIVIRAADHDLVRQLAEHSSAPVINAMTNFAHPCQAMADLMTIGEHFGSIRGRTLAFLGDGYNMARSLTYACGMAGVRFAMSGPREFCLSPEFVERSKQRIPELEFTWFDSPQGAVEDADVIYTDTWISMGQEDQREKRLEAFQDYQVNDALLSHAPPHAVVMHCLPAYRGYEIADSVLESDRSVVFLQSENRLHFQRRLLEVVMSDDAEGT
jgi:ornithine carbamoyltransferase